MADATTGAALAVERPSPISLRLVAAIVDFTIVMVLVVVVVALGSAVGLDDLGNAAGLVVVAAYPIVAIGKYGRTVGKRLCNLVVRRADGGPPGWTRAVVRFAVTAVPLVAATVLNRALGDDREVLNNLLQVVIGGLTYAPMVFDEQRRGLHDLLAGTRVVCTTAPLATIAEQIAQRAAEQRSRP